MEVWSFLTARLLCYVFCPTDALARNTMDRPSDDYSVASKTTPTPLTTSTSPDRTQASPSIERNASDVGIFQEVADFVLNFLSTSSNERLLGVFVLLTLMTYIILGRIGLLLIGVALGILLHASWEGSHEQGDEGPRKLKKRKELSLEVSRRLLDWPKPAALVGSSVEDDTVSVAAPEDLSAKDLDYATFQPATAAALRLLTDAVVQDYVK